jgi:hypothetical protein
VAKSWGPVEGAIRKTSFVVLILTSVLTLLSFEMPMRFAGLAVDATLRKNRDDRWIAFAVESLQVPANVLPLATVVIGVGRHITVGEQQWLGMNSLALLLASVFYFWQGLEAASNLPLPLGVGQGEGVDALDRPRWRAAARRARRRRV